MKNRVDNEISWVNPNHMKSESRNNDCNMSNAVVSKEISIMENKESNYFNPTYYKSKCFGDNIININRSIGNEFGSINF